MIAILVGMSVAGAISAAWYARKALGRIQRWGEKMDEVDAIFRSAATEEEMAAYSSPAQQGAKGSSGSRAAQVAVGVPR